MKRFLHLKINLIMLQYKGFKVHSFMELLPYLILASSIVILHMLSINGGVNMLNVGVMVVAFISIIFRYNELNRYDLGLVLLWFVMYLFATNNPHFRQSTFMYSGLFIFQFIALRAYSKYITPENYLAFIKILLYAFALVLFIQQISAIAGIQGFNRNGEFAIRFKMNSLAQEPSLFPPSIALLFLMYIRVKYLNQLQFVGLKQIYRENKKICWIVLYMLFTCGTTSAIILLPIILLFFLKSHIIKYIPFFVIALICGSLVIGYLYPQTIERISMILGAIGSLDPMQVYDADQSASARISPYLFYINDFDLSNWHFWFGFGHDYGTKYLSWNMLGEEMGYEIGIGGIVNFLYDYGAVIFLYFLLLMRKIVFGKFLSWDFFFWFVAFSMQTFNMPIFWAFFTFTYITKLFENNKYNTSIQKI